MGLRGGAALSRRALGVGLLAVSLLPIHRVLAHPETGPAGSATVQLADATLSLVWWGSLLILVLSLVLGRLGEAADPGAWVGRAEARLGGRGTAWAAGLPAGLAFAFATALSLGLFHGYPTALDEMAHLVQARYMAAGRLAGPAASPESFWVIQNTMIHDVGWSSQYPPLHTALLGLGLRLQALWITGPVLTGVTVLFGGLVAHRLIGERGALASWAALALACSVFVLALGAGYLSHVSAAALSTAGLWAGLRARDGRASWAVLAGVLAGALVATRPWIGLLLSGLFGLGLWIPEAIAGRGARWLFGRLGLAFLGSLPGGLSLAWYNARLYGSPVRFGYGVLQGPAHGLGFHADPWGNAYGPLEALGYTAADLLQLGVHLFETPVPALALVGAYLVTARKLEAGTRILVVWALLPVVANALYWHHGHHLGPRMLYESAPAWVLLTAVSAAGVVRALPRGWMARSARWAICLSVVSALVIGVPGRLGSYRWTSDTLARIQVPDGSDGALVFVHGAWSGRLSAELAGLGMRLDSVETAIRRNDTCRVQQFVDEWRRRGSRMEAEAAQSLDFTSRAGAPPGLRVLEVAPGSLIRSDPGSPPTGSCAVQARADRFGVVELAPLLWQGDLPGLERGQAMFVRDLGPDLNRVLLRAEADREPLVFAPKRESAPPELQPYDPAMELLWGEDGPRAGGGP